MDPMIRQLLEDLVDEEDCHLDHDGNCQAHDWFSDERACPQGRAKELLAEEP